MDRGVIWPHCGGEWRMKVWLLAKEHLYVNLLLPARSGVPGCLKVIENHESGGVGCYKFLANSVLPVKVSCVGPWSEVRLQKSAKRCYYSLASHPKTGSCHWKTISLSITSLASAVFPITVVTKMAMRVFMESSLQSTFQNFCYHNHVRTITKMWQLQRFQRNRKCKDHSSLP